MGGRSCGYRHYGLLLFRCRIVLIGHGTVARKIAVTGCLASIKRPERNPERLVLGKVVYSLSYKWTGNITSCLAHIGKVTRSMSADDPGGEKGHRWSFLSRIYPVCLREQSRSVRWRTHEKRDNLTCMWDTARTDINAFFMLKRTLVFECVQIFRCLSGYSSQWI